MWINLVVDHWDGGYLVPSPDGVTEGPLDGYRYRNNGRYDDPGGVAYYEDQYEIDQFDSEMVLNEMERLNVYATLDYTFDFWGGVDWDADFLYSNRQTKSEGWRQFFPILGSAWAAPYGFGYANDPDWNPEIGLPIGQPVIPYPSNSQIDVDYYFITTGFEGLLPTDSYWSWQIYGSYSYSDGSYAGNGILASRSGDWSIGIPDAPPINFYDPAVLGGTNMQAIVDAIGVDHKGSTVYDQFQVVGILAGDLFQMPAGAVGTAFGLEYRTFSIDDQPSSYSREGELWGSSSALVTKGSNDVWEAFVEAEIPLLAGKPGFEDLTLNVSGRYFDYKEGGSDTVWKAGLRWALTPTILLRGTMGTSYRAPALFELYLGDETGFVGQAGIDPCVNWGDSTNDNIRTNCAAEGIPDDYTGLGSSATVISGGGAGFLEPETSDAMTFGLVWTPEFSDLSIALDYVEIEVNNQIDDLGAGAIVSGCYNAQNFPNSFCDLFDRLPAGDLYEHNITEIHDAFINVNEQLYRGIDLNLVWNIDLSFGQLELAAQSTWNLENTQRLFDPSEVEGFDTTDYVGTIGSPDNTTNFRASLNWQDWRFNYYLQYVSATDDSPFVDAERSSYYGLGPAFVDITMDSVLYHNFSVIYQRDDWDVLVGVNNLFDEAPDTVSDVYRALRGNVPISASQYDLLGRSYFVRMNYRF